MHQSCNVRGDSSAERKGMEKELHGISAEEEEWGTLGAFLWPFYKCAVHGTSQKQERGPRQN